MRQVTVLASESGRSGDSSDAESEEETEEQIAKNEKTMDSVTSLRALTRDHRQFIGCNGRLNKEPDTCYSFWVGASLDVSRHPLLSKAGY